MKDQTSLPIPEDWIKKTGGYAKDMTLRDHFAAVALQGLLASEVNAPMTEFAETAYIVADLMLKAGE